MAKYSITKVGTLFAEDLTGANQVGAYFPTLLDTSALADWPWTVTCVSGFSHVPGVYLSGAVGDPTDPANWETYDEGKAAGRFAAWATATGQSLPAANPVLNTNSIESPRVVKVGSTYYLMVHGEDGAIQYSIMYTATAGLLNWTPLANGNGGVIIDPRDAPYDEMSVSGVSTAQAHRGYVTFGPNPFPDVPYDYVGYGISENGGQAYAYQYGSDDLATWTPIAPFSPERVPGTTGFAGSPTVGYGGSIGMILPSVRDAGGGEYVYLAVGQVAGVNYKGISEVYVSADGLRCTRDPVIVMGLGGTGADDELRILPGDMLEYGGDLLVVYKGQDSSAVDFDDVAASSLMLAIATYDPDGEKPPARVVPPHDVYRWNGATDTEFPAWITPGGTAVPTIAGGAIVFGAGSSSNIRGTGNFPKASTEWAEIWVSERATSAVDNGATFTKQFQFTPDPFTGTDYVRAYCTQASEGLSWRYRSGGADRLNAESGVSWADFVCRREHGLHWRITDEEMLWVRGRHRTLFDSANTYRDVSALTEVSGTDWYWAISTANASANPGGEIELERVEFRIANPSGNAVPEISAAEATSTSAVTFTLDRDCIGDGIGITVKDGGSPVAGAWTRPTLGTAVFTRISGTWSGSGALTYDISSTDLRSEADLVALADVAGGTIARVGEPEPPEETLDFVGPNIGNRTVQALSYVSITTASRFTGAVAYALTGALPDGLGFSSVTGEISGAPTETGVFSGLVVSGVSEGLATVDSDTFQLTVVENATVREYVKTEKPASTPAYAARGAVGPGPGASQDTGKYDLVNTMRLSTDATRGTQWTYDAGYNRNVFSATAGADRDLTVPMPAALPNATKVRVVIEVPVFTAGQLLLRYNGATLATFTPASVVNGLLTHSFTTAASVADIVLRAPNAVATSVEVASVAVNVGRDVYKDWLAANTGELT